MQKRPKLQKMMYLLLAVWLAGIYLNFSEPNILFTIVFTLYTIPVAGGSLAYSLMFFRRDKPKKLSDKAAGVVFLVPFLVLMFLALHQSLAPKPTPNEDQIHALYESYLKDDAVVIASNLSNYNAEKKSLILDIALNSDSFLSQTERNPQTQQAQSFMQLLQQIYIEIPQRLNEVSKKPKTITVYGYWDRQQIVEANFVMSHDRYVLSAPYPDLRLAGYNREIYLKTGTDVAIKIPLRFESPFALYLI
ncbi:hypothetical protein [Cohnella zeiphila]|uniref:Uncharacterized protein n=1 Tax=Cohnella zeiphila TaxID=2761120 RepID=A0A7X0SSM8_9BACL|nr:hypothetical protein [Cohnella zeiphila]MBB6735407.1 hypothetical protein [Cohnella zeiphila]